MNSDFRSRPLVILGAGYTGRFLYPLAKNRGLRTFATSRNPTHHLPHVSKEDRLAFDLLDPETWQQIPKDAHLIWCFPALPQDAAVDFIEAYSQNRGRVIMLGSTSAYGASQHSPVNENTLLDYSIPRVQSEEHLRRNYGAIILRLAGLYGPGRHVLDWIRKGKVKNTNKYVNLIHIEDVAGISLAALERAQDGEAYVLSDGMPRQWSEIFSTASKRWRIDCPSLSEPKNPGKRLNIDKLKTMFEYTFSHPDLYEALNNIEQGRVNSER